jgi:hypothetical protein
MTNPEQALATQMANMVVHLALQSDGQSAAEGLSTDQVLDGLYTGPKAALRPVKCAITRSDLQM